MHSVCRTLLLCTWNETHRLICFFQGPKIFKAIFSIGLFFLFFREKIWFRMEFSRTQSYHKSYLYFTARTELPVAHLACECTKMCSFQNEKTKNALRWCQRHSFQFHVFSLQILESIEFEHRLWRKSKRDIFFSLPLRNLFSFHSLSCVTLTCYSVFFLRYLNASHEERRCGRFFFYCIKSTKRVILILAGYRQIFLAFTRLYTRFSRCYCDDFLFSVCVCHLNSFINKHRHTHSIENIQFLLFTFFSALSPPFRR